MIASFLGKHRSFCLFYHYLSIHFTIPLGQKTHKDLKGPMYCSRTNSFCTSTKHRDRSSQSTVFTCCQLHRHFQLCGPQRSYESGVWHLHEFTVPKSGESLEIIGKSLENPSKPHGIPMKPGSSTRPWRRAQDLRNSDVAWGQAGFPCGRAMEDP